MRLLGNRSVIIALWRASTGHGLAVSLKWEFDLSNNLYLVIPVFNEAPNVLRLLREVGLIAPALLRSANCQALHVILIDDGSSDGTSEVAHKAVHSFVLHVCRHEHNRGPGAAFATGFEFLHRRLDQGDIVFTLEGDNTSRLETALRMLRRCEEGYDAVLASPYAYGGGFTHTSLFRLILSHGANGFMKGLIGVHGIHTMSSFFRLYRGSLVLRLQGAFGPGIIERCGFEGIVELLIKMILVRATISEVEMLLDSGRRVGKSKMKVFRTIRGYLALLPLRVGWSRQVQNPLWRYVNDAA